MTTENEKQDEVNHPKHYTQYSIEVIEATRLLPGSLSNVVKYVARAGLKGGKAQGLTDLDKALWYLEDFRKNCVPILWHDQPWLGSAEDALSQLSLEAKPHMRARALGYLVSVVGSMRAGREVFSLLNHAQVSILALKDDLSGPQE